MMEHQKFFQLLLISLLLTPAFVATTRAQQDGDDIAIGKYRVIHSDILGEDRLLMIHLPRDYENTQLSFPVLYILYADIYNYFADAAVIAEKLGSTGEIPPVIIVGVTNANRYRDLLPVKTGDRSEGGGADNFMRFLGEELIPHIERTYRTKNFRILAGPQAAAIFSLYTLMTKPGLFQAILAENPFMNPANSEYLLPRAESFFNSEESLKNFLYIKCEKDERPQDLENVRRFAEVLDSRQPAGFRYQVDIREPSGFFIPPLPWRDSLRMLFRGHKPPTDFKVDTIDDITGYYQRLSRENGFEVDPPDLFMTMRGNELAQAGKLEAAIGIFQYQLKQNPESLNALWQLGETERRMGRFEEARGYYQAFLAIRDTDAAMIHRRLEQVERVIAASAAYRIEQVIRKDGIEAGLKLSVEIRSDPKTELYFDQGEFNALGYRLLGSDQVKAALEIFKLTVEMYPESANAHDSLAEAHLKNGDTENAVVNYQKSLELNPENANAREKLKQLEQK